VAKQSVTSPPIPTLNRRTETVSHVDLMMSCGRWWSRWFRSPVSSAGWWDGAVACSGGVHRDRVCADQWVFVAGSAAVVRGAVSDRASPVQSVDQGRIMAPAPSRGTRRTGRSGVDRLVTCHRRRRGICPGEKGGSLTGPSPVDRAASSARRSTFCPSVPDGPLWWVSRQRTPTTPTLSNR
jgi:hypothetical protein